MQDVGSESTFSAAKRISGEHVTATKIGNIIQEVIPRFIFFNIINNLMVKRNA
jgi:hypothetical protein